MGWGSKDILLITGGTGFVGSYILEALEGRVARNRIRILARAGAELARLRIRGYQTAQGNVTNLEEVRAAMQGVSRVIHLVAIIRQSPKHGQTFDRIIGEGTENVARAAQEAGVKRFLYMSALGADHMSTGYYKNKIRGEQAVKATGIPYTIFRPSLLIGAGGEFTGLLKQLTMLPIVPVPGSGRYLFQPLYVRDVARYYAQALDDERYVSQTFEVGGPQTLQLNDMLRQTRRARGRRAILLHAPLFLVGAGVPLIERLAPRLITRDQFTMLLEGSVTEDKRLQEIGGFELTPFSRAIQIAFDTPPPDTYAKGAMRSPRAQ